MNPFKEILGRTTPIVNLRLLSLKLFPMQWKLRTTAARENAKRRAAFVRTEGLRVRHPGSEARIESEASDHDGALYYQLDNGQRIRQEPTRDRSPVLKKLVRDYITAQQAV